MYVNARNPAPFLTA